MKISRPLQKTVICLLLILLRLAASGQVRVKGTVYDRSARFGIPGVSVKSTSGAGTVTDSAGRYSILLSSADSLSFSYQGRTTQKFPLKEIPRNRDFNMSLHIDIKTLPTITVTARPRTYSLDSLENRNQYRKYFDYSPDFLTGGSGVDLSLLFGMRKARRMEHFRELLEQQERERYVDHRFNKDLVRKITGLRPPALDTFMIQYRPSYELLQAFENDYQYYEYIRDQGRFFYRIWRREHRVLP